MADLKLLERLCAARGISGYEDDVRRMILEEIKPFATRIEVTPLGNILAFKEGKQRAKTKLMLNAHMDEVGLIVTEIDADGLLKFATVGGFDRRVLLARSVTVGDNVPGVIGAKPIHLLEGDEKEKSVPISDMYIDIGAESKEDAEAHVHPGDPVTFHSMFDTAHGKIKTRALDDRAGCAIMIDLLKTELAYDMTFAFVVQEEVGLNGSRTASFAAEPQAAIILESTTAADVAGVPEEKKVCRVGQGPVLSFMDRHTIYDRAYYQLAFDVAKENEIPCQSKRGVAGGNDAGAIHVSRSGVRTVAVSLPCRYLHSAFSMIAQDDFHNTERLVLKLAEKIAASEA